MGFHRRAYRCCINKAGSLDEYILDLPENRMDVLQ